MKKILTALTCLCLLLSYSCSEDNCANSDCGPNGNCNPDDGTCICDEGFSGINCEVNVCDTVDCINGDCDPTTGNCLCERGFEGPTCDTEIRANVIGIYMGDIVPCVPAILGSQIPDDILDALTMTPIEVTASDSDITAVNIGASDSMILGIEVEADVTADEFIVSEFSQDLDIDTPLGTLTITVIGEGTGSFVDNNTMILALTLIYQTPLGEFNSVCEINFVK